MFADALAMAARCEEIKAQIRAVAPPDTAEAIFETAGRRAVTTSTRFDEALNQAMEQYLTGEEANGPS